MSGGSARRILVTGADGFIGSHLVESLVRAEVNICDVEALARVLELR